jgi:hypothetical protein
MLDCKPGALMAIIGDVRFGCGDGGPCDLTFTTYIDSCLAAGQSLNAKAAVELMEKHRLKRIESLNGRACRVDYDGHRIVFVELLDVPRTPPEGT